MSVRLSISLSIHPRQILVIIKSWPVIARRECVHRPQVMQYNIYSSTLSPHWGPKDPSGVQLSLYVCLTVYLSVLPHRFLVIIRVACNFPRHMRPQATDSNPLCDSIIFQYIHPSGCLRDFCNFCICTNF